MYCTSSESSWPEVKFRASKVSMIVRWLETVTEDGWAV